MIAFLIFTYILLGFFTYSFMSMSFDWPDFFDVLGTDYKTAQKDINKLVLIMVFWPICWVFGFFVLLYYVFKGIYWFIKNFIIAICDVFRSCLDYLKKIKFIN